MGFDAGFLGFFAEAGLLFESPSCMGLLGYAGCFWILYIPIWMGFLGFGLVQFMAYAGVSHGVVRRSFLCCNSLLGLFVVFVVWLGSSLVSLCLVA